MPTILDNRRNELRGRIMVLEEERALIDEQLKKLNDELDFLQDYVPATEQD